MDRVWGLTCQFVELSERLLVTADHLAVVSNHLLPQIIPMRGELPQVLQFLYPIECGGKGEKKR